MIESARKFNAASWAGVVATYAAASLLQVAVYGSGASGADTRTATAPALSPMLVGLVELVEAGVGLAWVLGPTVLATWFVVRKLKFWADAGTPRMTVLRSIAIILLPFLSINVGLAVSFTLWGTG